VTPAGTFRPFTVIACVTLYWRCVFAKEEEPKKKKKKAGNESQSKFQTGPYFCFALDWMVRTNSSGLTMPNCNLTMRRNRTEEYPKFSEFWVSVVAPACRAAAPPDMAFLDEWFLLNSFFLFEIHVFLKLSLELVFNFVLAFADRSEATQKKIPLMTFFME
jgi:hypothetical protein